MIVDIEVVTGEESDFARMCERLEALEGTQGCRPDTVTADRGYGHRSGLRSAGGA